MESTYLQLSKNLIKFEPVSKITSVFFDETNKEILSVRSGGTLGVVVKGNDLPLTFCMEDKGPITSIKLSTDHKYLIVQRSKSSVQIFSQEAGEVCEICTQEMRSKSSHVLGFIWCGADHFALIGDHAIELYQVSKEKNIPKFVKASSQTCIWYKWSPDCKLLILCLQAIPLKATLYPITIHEGTLTKMSKFEVDTQTAIGESDIAICTIYGKTCVCILRHSSDSSHGPTSLLDVFTQSKDGTLKRTCTCLLGKQSRFYINVVDNVIVAHDLNTKKSVLVDIISRERSPSSYVEVVAPGAPVEPFYLDEAVNVVAPCESPPSHTLCPTYAPTWVIFLPDIIIDAGIGCMWRLQLSLDSLVTHMEDKVRLVDCLLMRTQSKPHILNVIRDVIEKRMLHELSLIFDKINDSYRQNLESILSSQMGENMSEPASKKTSAAPIVYAVYFDQAEIYSAIFAPLMEQADKGSSPINKTPKGGVSQQLVIGVLMDYIRSLDGAGIHVQHFLYELVINGLVRTNKFYQLHQLLQYHVLSDSKPLACLLLSLVGVYEGGEQLSLDMLERLHTAHDEIIEVLLSHRLVTQALRYSRKMGLTASISARKFLEAAMLSQDRVVFFSTFKFFSLRNVSLRGSPNFVKGEHCDVYIDHFIKCFGCPDFSFQSS